MFFSRIIRRITDFCLTVLLWGYFLFGYLVLLPIFFLPYLLVLQSAAVALQRLNHLHLKAFFHLTRILIPKTTYEIDPVVRNLRSSVIVCNHISYLDPILLVSLYPRQTTIVKKTFFFVPIFGWFLRQAGYVPSSAEEMRGDAVIDHLESIKAHLADGGNLFVFPEGTRSRNGQLAPFSRGAFSIARYCRADVKLVCISNTDKLFRPGTFSFNTRRKNVIALKWIATLKPDYASDDFSTLATAREARQIFEREIAGQDAGDSRQQRNTL